MCGLVGCWNPAEPPPKPRLAGGALLLNLQPTNRPSIVGSYSFELLGQGTGKSCVTRGDDTIYWSGMTDLAELSSDRLTQQAIAAAMHDALTRLEADTILVTHVVTTSRTPDRVCANLVGRGVRLFKSPSKAEPPPVLPDDASLLTD